jgi:hypothetical protein
MPLLAYSKFVALVGVRANEKNHSPNNQTLAGTPTLATAGPLMRNLKRYDNRIVHSIPANGSNKMS